MEDPWLADAHTIVPNSSGNLIVSCSSSDSVLVVDYKTFKVVKAYRLTYPEYGVNYNLTRSHSVVKNFIPKDFRIAHVNSAWPWKRGILISSMRLGAIGWLNGKGKYTEIIRGFVGCHGVRTEITSNRIYFCDSCLGTVIFLDESFKIAQRIATGSVWLHDSQQLAGHFFANSLAYSNRIDIMNFSSREVLHSIFCGDFGLVTLFISYGK